MTAEPEQRYCAVEHESISLAFANMLARDVVGLAAVKLLHRLLEYHEIRPAHFSLTDWPGLFLHQLIAAGLRRWAAYPVNIPLGTSKSTTGAGLVTFRYTADWTSTRTRASRGSSGPPSRSPP